MLDHWSDPYLRKFELIIGPIGLIINLILLEIIAKHTPEALKTYSVMIRLITLSDIAMGISVVVQTARTFPTGTRVFVMFDGFCEEYSDYLETKAYFCMFWYTQKISSYMLNHVILIFSYIYRMVIITLPFDNFDRKKVHIACYSYSVLHYAYFTWVYYMCLEPMDKVNEALLVFRPELVGSRWTYFGILYPFTPSQIVMTLFSVVIPWVVIVVAVVCRWRISIYLERFQFSTTAKELHKSVLNVLFAQTLGPFLTTVTSILYMTINTRQDSVVPFLENVMEIPMGSMIMFNPIVTVCFVAPYRNAVLKRFGLYKAPIVPVLAGGSTSN